ncbi:MAG: hypothetical protein A2046_13770 [Bacteroidetes bacterium GWA2_30_7]|nr:MAG: hypothetical protein A2046_13770 [Bacteroidetes bacterium GWA2_30_7]
MNKILVTEEALDSAIELLNKANEKEYTKILKEFQKEQPYLSTYLFAINETYELEEFVTEELFNLSLIVWKSFKNSTNFVPVVSEQIIEEVEIESDELNKKLAESLGLDIEDEDAVISKLAEINTVFGNQNDVSEKSFTTLIEKNNLEGYFEKTKELYQDSQTVLMDFVSDEISAIEEIDIEDSYLYTEILFDIIKCIDKAINTTILKIVK